MAAGRRRTVQVWDAQTSALVGPPLTGVEREQLANICFAPKGGRMAVIFGNDSIEPSDARFYELPSLRPVGEPMRHGDGISSAALSTDGALFATGGEDNVVRLWHADTGRPASGDLRHPGVIGGVLFTPDGRVLATGCVDGSARLWDVERGELLAPPVQLGGKVLPRAFSADGRRLWVTAGSSATNVVWQIDLPSAPPAGLALEAVTESLTGQRAGNLRVPAQELPGAFLRWNGGSVPAWPADMQRWHEERAVLAELHGAWFTAAFHLERLIAAMPSDPALQTRLERARNQSP